MEQETPPAADLPRTELAAPSEAKTARIADDEVSRLRIELIDVREKLLALREKDLFELRDKVTTISTQFKLSAAIIAIALAVGGAFGVSKFNELNELISKTLTKKMEDSLGYYEQVTKAIVLANNFGCSTAISLFRDLHDQKLTDEVVFGHLTYCLNNQEDYQSVLNIFQSLKSKGLFPRNYRRSLSFNNVGLALIYLSAENPEFAKEAFSLFRKAEQIATTDEPNDLAAPLFNLLVYHLVYGEATKANIYADRLLKERPRAEWEPWIKGFFEGEWGKRLLAKRNTAQEQMEQLLSQQQ